MSALLPKPSVPAQRPLRPSGGFGVGGTSGGGEGLGDDRNTSPGAQKKRKITAVACRACQRKRCKCDGDRPRCAACVAAGAETECIYDTRSDQSRLDALKEKNIQLEEENRRLRALLASADTSGLGSPGNVATTSQYANLYPSRNDASTSSRSPTSAPTPSSELPGRDRPQGAQHGEVHDEPIRSDWRTASTAAAPSTTIPTIMSGPSGSQDNTLLRRNVATLEAELGQLRRTLSGIRSGGDLDSPVQSQWQQLAQNMASSRPMDQLMRHAQTQGHGQNARSRGFRWGGALLPLAEEDGSSVALRQPQAYHHRPQRFGHHLNVFGNLPMSSGIMSNHHTFSVQSAQLVNLQLPRHLIQMLNWEDHLGTEHGVLTPEFASSTFSSFRALGRRLINSGTPSDIVLGPSVVDVQQFFHSNQDPNTHTTATFAPWFLGAYPSMTITARVAAAVLMQRLLRWQIDPTPDHFDAIPEWLRPTAPQIFVPHLSAFDFLPWPQIREMLIDNDEPARQILAMIMSNLSVDWPGSTEEIFVWDYDQGMATGVNPAFVVHILDINSWAINSKVLDRFPYLEGKARFVEMTGELEQRAVRATDRLYGERDMEYAQ